MVLVDRDGDGHLEEASALGVEDGAEDGRGVEEGVAEPVDAGLRGDERRGVHVADETMVLDGGVLVGGEREEVRVGHEPVEPVPGTGVVLLLLGGRRHV